VRVGTSRGRTVGLPVRGRLSHQNGRVPRRNNARREEGPQTQASPRTSSLGSHWRADGLPKSAYATQGDALTAALIRRQDSGVELNVYRCDVCSAWHMGKPQRREPSSKRKK
jgi:hypothetical protein